MKRERGFTLIELMISITLVAALATGMLMAIRASLMSLEKVNSRLQFNRRVMGMEHVIVRQIGGVIPVARNCGTGDGRIPVFQGTPDSLLMVSSFSLAEGARGYPQVDEFQVIRGEQGFRLIVTEHPYTGPSSVASFCGGQALVPSGGTPDSMILADRLASCTFTYRDLIPDALPSEKWLQSWNKPDLPGAVKIEMTSLDSSAALLPLVSVTVPIHVTRLVKPIYEDARQ